jgi:small subunit ribosomal protein S16
MNGKVVAHVSSADLLSDSDGGRIQTRRGIAAYRLVQLPRAGTNHTNTFREKSSPKRVSTVAVRIRMKLMGRKHRPYYRIVAIDHHQPRDGRVIEELGTYDPMVKDKTKRVTLRDERIKYWQSVGALASERVTTLLKKFMGQAEAAAAPAAAPPA